MRFHVRHILTKHLFTEKVDCSQKCLKTYLTEKYDKNFVIKKVNWPKTLQEIYLTEINMTEFADHKIFQNSSEKS
jgi:hypothetical protein